MQITMQVRPYGNFGYGMGCSFELEFYEKRWVFNVNWTGEEDYRWSILRAKPGFEKWKWMLFNLIFISAYQMGLVLLTTLPALRVL